MLRSAPSPDDGALVAAFQAGEVAAFETIVKRHYPGLLRVAEMRCGSGALAEDAVQNGLVRAHRYLGRNGAIENLGAWLRRVVYNCATDLLRTERHDRDTLELAGGLAAPASTEVERRELAAIFEEAIAELPKAYREVLTLRYLHGIEAREVAARLNDNLNSVKSRIARGRRKLRQRLESVLIKAGYLA